MGESQKNRSRAALYVAAALMLGVAAWAQLAGGSPATIDISVNGAAKVVSGRAVAQDVAREYGGAAYTSGDLLDVEGEVLVNGGGSDPVVVVNGRAAKENQRLHPRDTVRVTAGADRVEATVVQYDYTPVDFLRKGRGPVPVVIQPGQSGIIKATVGEVSGKVSNSRQIREPIEPVVRYSLLPDPKLKVVALTFDDGPNPGETDSILRILRREKVRATFFLVGKNVDKHPELVAQIAREGHLLAAHSQTHRQYGELSAAEIEKETRQSIDSIERASGVRVDWIRPPYGSVSGTTYNELDRLSLNIALWSVDPKDWARPGFQKIINRVVFGVHPGAVVLFHDGGGNRSQTARALPGIIGELRDRGYSFVTMDEYAALAEAHNN